MPLRREHGMTLIEVLIGLLIVSIVIGGVAVSAGGVFSSRLGQTSGKLMAMIRYTYDRAVMNGKPYQLVVDIDEGKLWIEEMDKEKSCEARLREIDAQEKDGSADESSEALEQGTKKEDMILRTIKLPDRVSIAGVRAQHHSERVTEGQARILFFPDGTAERAFIWLAGDEDIFTVEVRALQGRGVLHREELPEREMERR